MKWNAWKWNENEIIMVKVINDNEIMKIIMKMKNNNNGVKNNK